MTDADFWEAERALWLGGAEAFRARIARDCTMVFPDPAGIVAGEAIVASIEGAPRWQRVDFAERSLARTGAEAVVLAYRAEASRPGARPYRALCGSSYVKAGERWRLVFHQQTPA